MQILDELQLASVRLLTNNPAKIEALEKAGITVARVPLRRRLRRRPWPTCRRRSATGICCYREFVEELPVVR